MSNEAIIVDDWATMSHREKQIFVSAYVDGSTDGTSRLCDALENKAAILKFKDGVADSDQPCLQFRPLFTHVNKDRAARPEYVDPYVTVIDDFYKHPECRGMPHTVLMEHLNDAEFKSGQELYASVRDGSAHWGFFTGFFGVEQCYGVDAKE